MVKRKAWIKHIFFTLSEHGAVRVLDAVITLVLIRALSAREFGLFSVYQSWVGFLLLVLPSLEIALYRDYSKLKNSGKLERELKVYRTFNYIKLVIAAVLVVGLSSVHQAIDWPTRLALLSLAFALPLSQAFYGFLREPLRFEMRQSIVAVVSAAQRLSLLGILVLIGKVYPANAVLLSIAALTVYFFFGLVWSLPSRLRETDHSSASLSDSWKAALKILGTTVLWIHLNGVITQFIQTLDTFFLNIFHVNLEEIGRYSIALKAANFFQIVPVALVNAFGVYLGRRQPDQDPHHEKKQMWRFTAVFLAGSVLLFGFGLLVEAPLLTFIGKSKIDASNLSRIAVYFRWQLAGVLILCASHPLSTYLGARAPLKKLFWQVFLPWLTASVIIYAFAAATGAEAAARANALVYGILLVLLGCSIKFSK